MPRWCWSPPISTRARCCCCPISPSTAATSRRPAGLVAVRRHRGLLRPARRAAPHRARAGRSRSTIRACLARFTAHHPSSAAYAGFADFHLYRVDDRARPSGRRFRPHPWIEGVATAASPPMPARWPRPSRRSVAADERGSCRCGRALCRASARPRRRRLADDRHRSRRASICAAAAKPPGSISPRLR